MEDAINALTDTLDTLRRLATVCAGTSKQHALRINAGRIIAMLREQMDTLDYEYTLFICELSPVTAEHYRRLYLDDVKKQMEVKA